MIPWTKLYCARWVLPMTAEAIEEARSRRGNGIVGVGKRDELGRQFEGAEVEELGEAVLLPGF